MKINLEECTIKSPEGEERNKLYKMLGEVFEVEKDLFENAISGKFQFCNWTPFSLYHGEEIAGNVSIIKMQIWFDKKPLDIYGIGSVATPEKFRKNGIAKMLMNHAMEEINKTGFPAVLFTDLPMVYKSQGFETIMQEYKMFKVFDIETPKSADNIEYLNKLEGDNLSGVKEVYEKTYPNYNGKFIRSDQKWGNRSKLYEPDVSQIITCSKNRMITGYINTEYAKKRITLTELCCAESDEETKSILLNEAINCCRRKGFDTISLAFDKSHFIWNLLSEKNISAQPETNAEREVFMVRGPHGNSAGPLKKLFWSLADKF